MFKRQQVDCSSFAWANRGTPLKALKWLFSSSAPLLFRPQFDLHQWLWSLKFLAQCNDTAFKRNVQLLVAVGAYSHQALKDVVADTGLTTTVWSAAWALLYRCQSFCQRKRCRWADAQVRR